MRRRCRKPVNNGRLSRYQIAVWLRELVAMGVLEKERAAKEAIRIRRRVLEGYTPWPK